MFSFAKDKGSTMLKILFMSVFITPVLFSSECFDRLLLLSMQAEKGRLSPQFRLDLLAAKNKWENGLVQDEKALMIARTHLEQELIQIALVDLKSDQEMSHLRSLETKILAKDQSTLTKTEAAFLKNFQKIKILYSNDLALKNGFRLRRLMQGSSQIQAREVIQFITEKSTKNFEKKIKSMAEGYAVAGTLDENLLFENFNQLFREINSALALEKINLSQEEKEKLVDHLILVFVQIETDLNNKIMRTRANSNVFGNLNREDLGVSSFLNKADRKLMRTAVLSLL